MKGFGPGPALYAPLPTAVTVHGRAYALNTGHPTALRALAALEDGRLAPFEQQAVVLGLLYRDAPPADTGAALAAAAWFLNGGQEAPAADGPRVYSLAGDGALIAAALRKSCGVDVWGPPMHWWQFASLLWEIGPDTLFARVVYLRRQRALGRLSAEERRAAAALGHLMDLPPAAGAGAPASPGEAAFFSRLAAAGRRAEKGREQHGTDRTGGAGG